MASTEEYARAASIVHLYYETSLMAGIVVRDAFIAYFTHHQNKGFDIQDFRRRCAPIRRPKDLRPP